MPPSVGGEWAAIRAGWGVWRRELPETLIKIGFPWLPMIACQNRFHWQIDRHVTKCLPGVP